MQSSMENEGLNIRESAQKVQEALGLERHDFTNFKVVPLALSACGETEALLVICAPGTPADVPELSAQMGECGLGMVVNPFR
jgi:hypothetical protein